MSNETYNGWTNYETWLYKLWMDQGGTDYWLEQAKDIYKEADSDHDKAAITIKEALQYEMDEACESWMPEQSGVFADMLNGALSKVNWYEIASSLLDDLDLEDAA